MRHSAALLSLCIVTCLLVHPVYAQETAAPWPTDGWQTSSPEVQGMDSAPLTAMLKTIADQDMGIHSVLVIRNGYLVLEAYNYPYTADDLHTVYSVTKSVNSALMGIAIDKGLIEGGQQTMLTFFPDYTPANLDEAKQSITLDNLLTMSPGFEWPGGMNEPLLGDMMDTDDWIQFMLDRPMSSRPGQTFVYNSGVANLLAAITARAAKQPLLDFAKANLFQPLGIEQVEWATDPQGNYLGGFGLQLTPRDMAKIGYLYLNGGQWDGAQIISSGWVDYSTQKRIDARQVSDGYGYQWWTNMRGFYIANGYGGQRILVVPDQNLVVVFTSALPTSTLNQPEAFLQGNILPAIQSDAALPENPDGDAALQEAIDALAHPTPDAVPAPPETAAQISGKTFQLDANDLGWESLALTFDEGNIAQLSLNGETPLNIGLDSIEQVNQVTDAKAIFAIGFDNILRVNRVAGAEPILLKGSWPKDNRFAILINLQGTVNWYQITLTFKDQGVQGVVGNGLSGRRITFEGRAS